MKVIRSDDEDERKWQMKVSGRDDEACDWKWWEVWVEVTIKVAVTMKEIRSDDDFELNWRWRKQWTEMTMKVLV